MSLQHSVPLQLKTSKHLVVFSQDKLSYSDVYQSSYEISNMKLQKYKTFFENIDATIIFKL
jgi:hypothetical protein